MKKNDMLSYDLKSAVKEVLGTCVSIGITVNKQKPRELIRAIDAGEFDKELHG
jgi:large subunit ribosomal protein L11